MAQTETRSVPSVQEAEAYRSPYERWKDSQGIPTIRGYWVKNLYEVELTPWPARGGAGVFVNLEGTGGFNDMYVFEIPPGKSTEPIKHIYEETAFILKGVGSCTVWNDPARKQTFEWRERSYFSVPPNATHQFHNLSGSEPVRYISMTAAPRVLDTFKDLDFVFNNPWVFKDRFNDQEGYFTESKTWAGHQWHTNFVADVIAATPYPDKVTSEGRGGGTVATIFNMVNSTVRSHSQAWPVGTHSKLHRHGPGIHVVLLRGEGYSLMGLDYDSMERIDWAPGSMFVPPENWWHGHFNTSRDPALFLAIGWGSDKPKSGGRSYVYKPVRDGGDQFEFDEEDSSIHKMWEEELAKNGVECRMGPVHPYCTHK